MSSAAKWADLIPRAGSAVVMLVVGLACVWLGGLWYSALIALAVGCMIYELRLLGKARDHRVGMMLGALAAAVTWFLPVLPNLAILPVIAGMMAATTGGVRKPMPIAFAAAMIMVAGYVLVNLRTDAGIVWVFWLLFVVIASDVAGYFVGKAIGGPKFWPRLSPKKTWSGTAGGWIAAGGVGALFAATTGAGPILIPVSAMMAFAAQMGDIGESWLKRRAGVKDSSNLIPGHGGFMDRFDGLVGACMIALFVVGAL
ncbi:phosphatidate cytidylyltransferase [Donghicola sp. C2-DW-16]|uniref:Phosphatidate cytidylyltransferase n=1 Tax=Donghicola mangrovi TaxID=2729614 RepID=A0A850Q450_9RHOB|nr:phosphatidate cytidylyltransferase [Donghicola mangrovi]NVO23733.1 phosphatidate cytidylyltransferase [Donghicola mangrovi]NVO26793.1 phosphatidate cytidylyltransferase [Donghicola mangrovi]